VTIFASGSVDEYVIKRLAEKNAPIDGFGIGTHMDTSADAPYLDCAYKLVEYAGKPRRKRSEGKVLWPGRKQVFRSYDQAGHISGDILGLESDPLHGERLILPVMKQGRRIGAAAPLRESRAKTLEQLKRLPNGLRGIEPASPYPVTVADSVRELARALDAEEAR
jgi:nicotinate phosphoribosyltransferase